MVTLGAIENSTSVVSHQSSVVSKAFATTASVGADASSAQPSKARLPTPRVRGEILLNRATLPGWRRPDEGVWAYVNVSV